MLRGFWLAGPADAQIRPGVPAGVSPAGTSLTYRLRASGAPIPKKDARSRSPGRQSQGGGRPQAFCIRSLIASAITTLASSSSSLGGRPSATYCARAASRTVSVASRPVIGAYGKSNAEKIGDTAVAAFRARG